MNHRTRSRLTMVAVFGLGLGVGVGGGFALNDYVERENPDAIQEIRQELQTQQHLDDFFAGQQAEQAEQAEQINNPSSDDTTTEVIQ